MKMQRLHWARIQQPIKKIIEISFNRNQFSVNGNWKALNKTKISLTEAKLLEIQIKLLRTFLLFVVKNWNFSSKNSMPLNEKWTDIDAQQLCAMKFNQRWCI